MQAPALTRFRIDIKDNGVAEVVLNRPNKLNVMDDIFFTEVGVAFDFIEKSPQVNVAVLWAEGRLFTAGLDLKSMGGVMAPGKLPNRLILRFQISNSHR